jgi:hypothetical protein
LSVCRRCGSDVREQDGPRSDGEEDLDPYLVVEEIYERSFERGWFSLLDGERLLRGPTPAMCPWDWKTDVPVYPDIEKDFAIWVDLKVRARNFKNAFNRWIGSNSGP